MEPATAAENADTPLAAGGTAMNVDRVITIRRNMFGSRYHVAPEPPHFRVEGGSFRDFDAAMKAAEELSNATGWPWISLVEADGD